MEARTATKAAPQPIISKNCDCARPIPEERADQRGAARTYCARCDRPVPLRWVSA